MPSVQDRSLDLCSAVQHATANTLQLKPHKNAADDLTDVQQRPSTDAVRDEMHLLSLKIHFARL